MIFKIAGKWLRGAFLMLLGGFWLGIAYYLSGFGGTLMQEPTPTVIGLSIIGSLTFGAGLIIFMRGLMMTTQRAPLPDGSTGWRDDGERSEADSGFDPDAAIARYLQNRADGVPSPISDAASGVPQRPTFGRKQT
jgi:hypothetical protein